MPRSAFILHGLGQTPSDWEEVLAGLASDDRSLHCPDLFSLLEHRPCTYARLYQAFQEACAAEAEPFDLCGLSLGAVLALQYGVEHPKRVRSLTLIAPQYRMPKGLLRLQQGVFHLLPAKAFAKAGCEKADLIRLTASMRQLDFEAWLDRLDMPVLLVCGERDRVNRKAAMRLKERLPKARFVLLKGAGHEANWDAPAALARLLRAFWQETE